VFSFETPPSVDENKSLSEARLLLKNSCLHLENVEELQDSEIEESAIKELSQTGDKKKLY
jgi:hypothetical protein